MFPKILLICLLLIFTNGLFAEHQATAKTENTEETDTSYFTYPRYNFSYGVKDFKTGDFKNQNEERDGDVLRGQYTVANPDGVVRTVSYVVDKDNGFQAVIKENTFGGNLDLPQHQINSAKQVDGKTDPEEDTQNDNGMVEMKNLVGKDLGNFARNGEKVVFEIGMEDFAKTNEKKKEDKFTKFSSNKQKEQRESFANASREQDMDQSGLEMQDMFKKMKGTKPNLEKKENLRGLMRNAKDFPGMEMVISTLNQTHDQEEQTSKTGSNSHKYSKNIVGHKTKLNIEHFDPALKNSTEQKHQTTKDSSTFTKIPSFDSVVKDISPEVNYKSMVGYNKSPYDKTKYFAAGNGKLMEDQHPSLLNSKLMRTAPKLSTQGSTKNDEKVETMAEEKPNLENNKHSKTSKKKTVKVSNGGKKISVNIEDYKHPSLLADKITVIDGAERKDVEGKYVPTERYSNKNFHKNVGQNGNLEDSASFFDQMKSMKERGMVPFVRQNDQQRKMNIQSLEGKTEEMKSEHHSKYILNKLKESKKHHSSPKEMKPKHMDIYKTQNPKHLLQNIKGNQAEGTGFVHATGDLPQINQLKTIGDYKNEEQRIVPFVRQNYQQHQMNVQNLEGKTEEMKSEYHSKDILNKLKESKKYYSSPKEIKPKTLVIHKLQNPKHLFQNTEENQTEGTGFVDEISDLSQMNQSKTSGNHKNEGIWYISHENIKGEKPHSTRPESQQISLNSPKVSKVFYGPKEEVVEMLMHPKIVALENAIDTYENSKHTKNVNLSPMKHTNIVQDHLKSIKSEQEIRNKPVMGFVSYKSYENSKEIVGKKGENQKSHSIVNFVPEM